MLIIIIQLTLHFFRYSQSLVISHTHTLSQSHMFIYLFIYFDNSSCGLVMVSVWVKMKTTQDVK